MKMVLAKVMVGLELVDYDDKSQPLNPDSKINSGQKYGDPDVQTKSWGEKNLIKVS